MRRLPLSEIHAKYVKSYNDYMENRYDEIRFHLGHLHDDIAQGSLFQDPSKQILRNALLDYIEELKNNVRRFVTMNPSDMKAVIDKIAGHQIKKKISVNKIYLSPEKLRSKFERKVYDYRTKNQKIYKGEKVVWEKKFYEHIVDIMEYEDCKKEISNIYRKMGLKICVYCNAQYAIGFSDGRQKHAAYEFDHFYDKSEWPCFASSFYNLQPSCGYCNRTKLNKRYHFNLYSCSKLDLDVVKFQLPLNLFVEFWQAPKKDLLKIEIKKCSVERKNISKLRKKKIDNENNLILNEFVSKLRLEGLYQEHMDEIEKVLVRAKSNTPSYQNQLRNTYNNGILQIFMSFHEYLYNFSKEAEDIHRQPLTKVKQDVFNQLSEIDSFKNKEEYRDNIK